MHHEPRILSIKKLFGFMSSTLCAALSFSEFAHAQYSGDPAQLFDGAHYAIYSRHSGKCIDVSDWSRTPGQILQQWDCNYGQPNQSWRLARTSDSIWALYSDFNGMCLDVANQSNSNGAAVVQSDRCFGNNFNLRIVGSLAFSFHLIFGHSGKCVDVKDWSHRNGAKLQQWECNRVNAQANQEWYLVLLD